jgi:hypothetical protein
MARFDEVLTLALASLMPWGGPQATPAGDQALTSFAERVTAYVELHRQLEGPVPTVTVSSDAAEIRRAIDALGSKIRRARAGARRGDIFSPEIARLVRARITKGCGGDFNAVHAFAHDEVAPMPAARVNGKWPGEGMTAMPNRVLCELPALPEELEYRFVNRDLVLWDMHADVIVDVLPDALAAR